MALERLYCECTASLVSPPNRQTVARGQPDRQGVVEVLHDVKLVDRVHRQTTALHLASIWEADKFDHTHPYTDYDICTPAIDWIINMRTD